jgi:hypothetical protein
MPKPEPEPLSLVTSMLQMGSRRCVTWVEEPSRVEAEISGGARAGAEAGAMLGSHVCATVGQLTLCRSTLGGLSGPRRAYSA